MDSVLASKKQEAQTQSYQLDTGSARRRSKAVRSRFGSRASADSFLDSLVANSPVPQLVKRTRKVESNFGAMMLTQDMPIYNQLKTSQSLLSSSPAIETSQNGLMLLSVAQQLKADASPLHPERKHTILREEEERYRHQIKTDVNPNPFTRIGAETAEKMLHRPNAFNFHSINPLVASLCRKNPHKLCSTTTQSKQRSSGVMQALPQRNIAPKFPLSVGSSADEAKRSAKRRLEYSPNVADSVISPMRNKIPRMSPAENRKMRHRVVERKRTRKINLLMKNLKEEVQRTGANLHKFDKASILHAAINCIKELRTERESLQAARESLRVECANLQAARMDQERDPKNIVSTSFLVNQLHNRS